nr:myosin-2 heavy chain-like isoform X2 [Lytechinus pictus]
MKKFLKGSKSKTTAPAASAKQSGAEQAAEAPGYVVKEKDLSKLHKAAWTGDTIKIKQLTKKGDVNVLDKENRTPLHLASSKGHIDVIDVLIACKAKLNMCDNDQRSPLMKAVQGNFGVCVETLLINKADPNLVDKNGNTALHLAAIAGAQDPTLFLLENGAMVNAANKDGSTALHLAAANKHDEIIEILLNEDVHVNATDNENRTALMWACQTDQIGVVRQLLSNKADIDVKDSKGWTANDHAIMGGFHGCSHLIDEYISSRRPASVLRSTGGTGGMFGSTAGTDALGFSLGGPAMDDFDDEDEDMSEGRSAADSWAASASEVEDPPVKIKSNKPSKPIKLTKFMSQDSDNESIHSNASVHSTASRSRIPRARSNSKESLRSARSVRSDVSAVSGSKIPRLKSPEKERRKGPPTSASASPGKIPLKRRDTEEDENDVTPRGDASVTPTPRESVISAARTISDFDDDDDLFPPSDNDRPKLSLGGKNKPNVSAMLNKLGMSDLEDDDEEEEDDSWLTNTKKDKQGTVKRGPVTPDIAADRPHEDENESDWDSDDNLLPSEGSNTNAAAKQTGAEPIPEKRSSTQDVGKRKEGKVPVQASPDQSGDQWDTDEEEEEEEEESEWEKDSKVNKEQQRMEEERQRQWEEDERRKKEKLLREAEEEIQKEKEELARQAELERQQNEEERQRLEEERQKVDQERKKAEREKQAAEEQRMKEEQLKQKDQEEKLKREKELMEEELAREKQQLEEEKMRLETENAAQEKRKREEEERRETERKEQLRMERERMEMDLEKERERIEAERRQVEEERNREAQRKQEAEQEIADEREREKKQLENERKEELSRIEAERRRLLEEKQLEEKRQVEEKKRLEEERKSNERKLEEERQRLEEKRRQEEETRRKERQQYEEEKQQTQLMLTAEREKLDTEKQKQIEEKIKIDELKKHFEMLRRQQEEDKKKLQAAKEEAEEKQRLEEERLKREEKRLEDERKRHEDVRKQLEDELFKKRSAGEADDADRQAAAHHLEDERKRLEDERQRIEHQRKEFEDQQIKEKTSLSTLERSMKEEKAKLEQSWRELDQKRQDMEKTMQEKYNDNLNATGDLEGQLKKEAELASKAKEELQQEKQRLQEEREQLMNRTREMEQKRNELEEMKKMMRLRMEEQRKQRDQSVARPAEMPPRRLQETGGDHSVDQALNLYQQNIERRLMDEERSDTVSSISQFDGMIDELTHEMESMKMEKDQMEMTDPVLYSSMGQSMGMTAGTDGTFIKLHNTSELGHHSGIVPQSRPLMSSLPPSLLNHNAANSNKKQQPEWMGILNEGDGLDYSSSEEGNGSTADDGGQLGTLPLLASTPIAPLTGVPQGSLDTTLDAATVMQFQHALRDMRRRADREKSSRLNMENRCKTLQSEKQDLYNKLMAVSEMKAGLESKILDLESQIRNYAHRLDQETEKHSNAELILKKTKQQLIKREEAFTKEVEAKQRAELAARTIQVDLKSAANLIKQLEEERDELRKKAMSERNARLMHQDILQDQEEKEKMFKNETSKYHYQKAEAISRLEAADESRKAALSQNDRLKGDLYSLKVELERQRIHHHDNQGLLATENQELNSKIEELKSDIQVNEEALAHATMAFNAQLAAVRAENTKLYSKVEKGETEKDRLQTELSSAKKLVNTTNIELEKSQLVRKETERELKRKEEEWSRSAEKLYMEISSLKENSQSSTRKLSSAENKIHRLENELQVATATLRERSNQLSALKRELEKGATSQQSHDAMLQKERNENARLSAKIETLTEKLSGSKAQVTSLQQALDAVKNENREHTRETANAQDKLNTTLTTMQTENNRARTIWEEKHSNMADTMTRVKEDFRQSEHHRQLREQELRQIQQELTEALRKQSIAEANLEIRKKALEDQQRDKEGVKSEMKQVQDQVLIMQQERRTLETRIEELQNELLQAERNGMATSQQLVSTNKSLQKLSELEERLRHFEAENSRLEIVVKQLEERSEGLKTDLQESQKIRSGLEALVTTLKTSNLQIEGKLNEEFAARNIYAKEAEEHKDLWETEVKSRSRIGIRISQLEKEKARMQADVEEERRQMRKGSELKKNLEIKYDSEVEKNRRLEQELNSAKAKMKLMRRKLKELEAPELRISTLQSEFERERINMDGTMANIRRQLEDVNQQLERENLLRMDLEKDNRRLLQEINSSKSALKNKDKLERSKRKLQDELSQTKMSMQHNYVEKGELERYKQELDAKARSEINQKLEQVNSYLEQQSAARDRLEQIRQSGEEEAKRESEDTITNLKTETSQLRSTIHELQSQKTTQETEVARLKELHRREVETRERLGADLERTQDRLVDLTSRMTMERQKPKHTRTSSLDLTPSKVSPRRASSPVTGVDPITEKVRLELDKSIERHLQAAPKEFGSSFHSERVSRDTLNNSLSAGSFGLSQNNKYMSVLRKNYFV